MWKLLRPSLTQDSRSVGRPYVGIYPPEWRCFTPLFLCNPSAYSVHTTPLSSAIVLVSSPLIFWFRAPRRHRRSTDLHQSWWGSMKTKKNQVHTQSLRFTVKSGLKNICLILKVAKLTFRRYTHSLLGKRMKNIDDSSCTDFYPISFLKWEYSSSSVTWLD